MLNISSVNLINPKNAVQTGSVGNASYASSPINVKGVASAYSANSPMTQIPPSFYGTEIRTKLNSNEEKNKYNAVVSIADKTTKKQLDALLKTGALLNSNSNDNSTVLDNLHKIATTPRVLGLSNNKLISEVVQKISKPHTITQKFGDIPSGIASAVLTEENKHSAKPIHVNDLKVHSSTCPAASIEFNLAHKMPAEFARMAEGLSSQNMSVTKKIKMNELASSPIDVIWMLNEFNTPHKLNSWNDLTVELKPDRNAIVRARVQSTYQDKGERSPLDVLMQSTFMNVGAQNTYNTLIDKRVPKYNDDDGGLTDIEKNFAEEIAMGKGRVCVTYQKIEFNDDPNAQNGKLVGYECEPEETLQHIQETLNGGDNVIIGYTYCDDKNNVLGGHEITITGIETAKDGKKYFICNDTDDGIDAPIKYSVDELLPKIHHAGIPLNVLKGKAEFAEAWKELMKFYKESKTNAQAGMAA